jgi:hypothetical protein
METLDFLDLLKMPPPQAPSITLAEPPNNDVLLVRFAVAGGPEQVTEGRVAQMFCALASRGSRGVTSAEFPAGVRVSDSVFKLRRNHGLGIETERVGHDGLHPGLHGIYRLSSPVRVFEIVRAAEMRARKAAEKAAAKAKGRGVRHAA